MRDEPLPETDFVLYRGKFQVHHALPLRHRLFGGATQVDTDSAVPLMFRFIGVQDEQVPSGEVLPLNGDEAQQHPSASRKYRKFRRLDWACASEPSLLAS